LGDKQIKVLSGGERSRVLLGKLLARPTNILLLDEPTNHLDMESINSLSKEVLSYKGSLIVVTHNEFLLRTSKINRFIVFRNGGIEIYNGFYDEFLEDIGWDEEDVD